MSAGGPTITPADLRKMRRAWLAAMARELSRLARRLAEQAAAAGETAGIPRAAEIADRAAGIAREVEGDGWLDA